MAEKVTPKDFVRWTTEQIDPADVSALMSDFGYTDDSQESIMDAIERHPNFRTKYGKLLRKSVAKRKAERNRSIGGVRMEDDSVTIDEWKEIVRQKTITKATGTNLNQSSSSGTEKKPTFWDYFTSILGMAGGVATSIWGKPVEEKDDKKDEQSGMNTFLVIIVVVVVIAVGAIIWASSIKK